MPVETIADVIEALSERIEESRRVGSRLGYFPALYRKVTREVDRAVAEGAFDDNKRMADLDVRFARRYLDAIEAYRDGEPTTRSWKVCLGAAADDRPIVLQHLALAMNAHINLDLGIAAAQTAPGASLPGLRRDFEHINRILASLVGEVERDLSRVWPLLRPIDWIGGRSEEQLTDFSLEVAREHAWRFAEQLAPLSETEQAPLIERVDRCVASFGRHVQRPSLPLRIVQTAIRLGERPNVREIIDFLA